MLIVLVVSLYTTRIVLRVLGATDYGVYNVVAGIVAMFAFINTSMTISIQRYYNHDKGATNGKNLNLNFNTGLQIQACIATITFLLLESIGLWYVNHVMVVPASSLVAANWVFQCAVLSLITVIIQVPYLGIILAEERMNYYAYISILDVSLKLLFAVLLPYVSVNKLIFYGFLSFTVSIIDLLCYILYAKKHFNEIHIRRTFKKVLFKEMIAFSGWNLLDMLSFTLKNQGLTILINFFFGPIVNAARAVSSQINYAIQGFSSNIVTAYRPKLVESYAREEYEETIRLMYSMTKMSLLLLTIISLPVIMELKPILNLWLGDNVPEYTYIFSILVLVDMILNTFNTPISQVAVATGKIKKYQALRSLVTLLLLPISWICFRIGLNATSGYVVCIVITIINQIVSLYLLNEIIQFKISDYVKKIVLPSIIYIILSIIPLILIKTVILENTLQIISIVLISISLTVFLGYNILFSKSERILINGFLRRIIYKQ